MYIRITKNIIISISSLSLQIFKYKFTVSNRNINKKSISSEREVILFNLITLQVLVWSVTERKCTDIKD